MQMSVSCLLVLGEKARDLVDARTTEHWFSSYIGMYTVLLLLFILSCDP